MLPKQWKITHDRNLCNAFAKDMLNIQHFPNAEYNDLVTVDLDKVFHYSVQAFGLQSKAKMKELTLP
jgi:hypothetical protein